MTEQRILDWSEVQALPPEGTVIWTFSQLDSIVSAALPHFIISHNPPQAGLPRVIVIGGGALIDQAKLWKSEVSPSTWLCAIPSLWGSGAEASPVAVRTVDHKKEATLSEALLPNARSVLPQLAAGIPADLARWGMGDAWSHALEGFLSPLATPELRKICADFIRLSLLPVGLRPDPHWYELSATACALQAKSGVGLVHAFAYVLEPKLNGFGHARLCSLLLWPVFQFNRTRGTKQEQLCSEFGIDSAQLDTVLQQFFVASDFQSLLPTITTSWMEIIRHPLARINCTLVRPDSLSWFQSEVCP